LCLLTDHHRVYGISPKKKPRAFGCPRLFFTIRFRTNLWADLSTRLNNSSSNTLSAFFDRFSYFDLYSYF
jgi:hypothetical protein